MFNFSAKDSTKSDFSFDNPSLASDPYVSVAVASSNKDAEIKFVFFTQSRKQHVKSSPMVFKVELKNA
jgi:hypothetical protein